MLSKFVAMMMLIAPLALVAHQNHQTDQSTHHKEITGDQLKEWYDQKKPMVVLDARSKPYFDGTLLPNAKWVPHDSSENEIMAAAPSKNSVIVVYCAGVDCPASGRLYDKLASMGYKTIYEYHEGLEDWLEKGYPTTKQSKK